MPMSTTNAMRDATDECEHCGQPIKFSDETECYFGADGYTCEPAGAENYFAHQASA